MGRYILAGILPDFNSNTYIIDLQNYCLSSTLPNSYINLSTYGNNPFLETNINWIESSYGNIQSNITSLMINSSNTNYDLDIDYFDNTGNISSSISISAGYTFGLLGYAKILASKYKINTLSGINSLHYLTVGMAHRTITFKNFKIPASNINYFGENSFQGIENISKDNNLTLSR